jgi:hypothetical protein
MQFCKTCHVEHPLDAFETYRCNGVLRHRLECKKARAARRTTARKNAPAVDPATVPKPEACAVCGDALTDANAVWRSDLLQGGWRERCKTCASINAEGFTHSQAFRKRQMTQDPEAFRARNAATHLEWARQNPDKVAHQQLLSRTDPERRFKGIVTYVKAKYGADNLAAYVAFEDEAAMVAKLRMPCHYCGHLPGAGEGTNGLDRIVATGPYSDANTATCCGVCNNMKLTHSLETFIQGVRNIAAHRGAEVEAGGYAGLPRPRALGGTAERRAAAKDKSSTLTPEEQRALVSSACYLCGAARAGGIDRVDAMRPYVLDNCQPCCSLCNYMKKDWELREFLGQVVRIERHTREWHIGAASTRGAMCRRRQEDE